MDDFLKFIPFLASYDPWVRIFVVLWGAILLAVLVVAPRNAPSETTPSAQTSSGDNSPNTIGNNNTVNSPQTTINNSGISEDTMRELLRDKSIAANRELTDKYPYGYVLFGVANGKLIYRPDLKDVDFQADWDGASVSWNPQKTVVKVFIPQIRMKIRGSYIEAGSFSSTQQFVEGAPRNTKLFNMYGTRLYYEILDSTKGIFVLGLSDLPIQTP